MTIYNYCNNNKWHSFFYKKNQDTLRDANKKAKNIQYRGNSTLSCFMVCKHPNQTNWTVKVLFVWTHINHFNEFGDSSTKL